MTRPYLFVLPPILLLGACVTTPAPRSGAELVDHSLRVEVEGGPTLTLRFQGNGSVIANNGGREATGTWAIADSRICLEFPRQPRDCWPYTASFAPGKTVAVTNSAGATVRATLIE